MSGMLSAKGGSGHTMALLTVLLDDDRAPLSTINSVLLIGRIRRSVEANSAEEIGRSVEGKATELMGVPET